MSKHTPEPWFYHRQGFSTVYIEARIGGGMLQEIAACGPCQDGTEQQDENARRIVACVNACAGVDTDLLEAGELSKPTMLVMQENKDLKRRCDELLVALEWSDSQIMEFISIAFRHAVIKGDFELSDVRDALKVISSKSKGGAV